MIAVPLRMGGTAPVTHREIKMAKGKHPTTSPECLSGDDVLVIFGDVLLFVVWSLGFVGTLYKDSVPIKNTTELGKWGTTCQKGIFTMWGRHSIRL